MKHDKPAIGVWGAACCILDVQRIDDEDDLAFTMDWDSDGAPYVEAD